MAALFRGLHGGYGEAGGVVVDYRHPLLPHALGPPARPQARHVVRDRLDDPWNVHTICLHMHFIHNNIIPALVLAEGAPEARDYDDYPKGTQ